MSDGDFYLLVLEAEGWRDTGERFGSALDGEAFKQAECDPCLQWWVAPSIVVSVLRDLGRMAPENVNG